MIIDKKLSLILEKLLEKNLPETCLSMGLIEDPLELESRRFLNRSVAPHLMKLSQYFNQERDSTAVNYWKEAKKPQRILLAYALGFLPNQMLRAAAVWSELRRLGFALSRSSVRALDIGAGPGSVASGFLAAESVPGGNASWDWKLYDQAQLPLRFAKAWIAKTAHELNMRTRVETLSRIPHEKFDLITLSFYLNELGLSPKENAQRVLELMKTRLNPDGVAILIEPGLRLTTRKLHEIRAELIKSDVRILLPCLGEQACGALLRERDWCHETLHWNRPRFLQRLDMLTQLNHRSLPLSYLVLTLRSSPIEKILPALEGSRPERRFRQVTPSHWVKTDLEFELCGQNGKKVVRIRGATRADQKSLSRGTVLKDAEVTDEGKSYLTLHALKKADPDS